MIGMATKADIVYFKCFQDGTLFVLRYHKTKKHSTVDNSIRSLEATLRTMNSAAPFVSVGDLYSGKLRSFGGNDRLDDPLFREIFAPASDRRVEGELALCRDVAMWRASPSQNVESSIMDGDEDGDQRRESRQQLDSPNVRVAKKCRKGEDEEAGLFSEFGKMFNSGLKSQNEGYQTLREVHQKEMKVHKQEMQTLVEENKELYRKNVELGMEAAYLKRKVDKAKARNLEHENEIAALRAELEQKNKQEKRGGGSTGPVKRPNAPGAVASPSVSAAVSRVSVALEGKSVWMIQYWATSGLEMRVFNELNGEPILERIDTIRIVLARKDDGRFLHASLLHLNRNLSHSNVECILKQLIFYELFSSGSVALESSSPYLQKHEYLDIPCLERGAVGAGKDAIIRYLRAWQKQNDCVWLGDGKVHFPFGTLSN